MIKVKDRTLSNYMQENPNELTKAQMEKIFDDIDSPISNVVCDETYDFLRWSKGLPGRQEMFYEYIRTHYKDFFGKRVLEVGCGPRARLSRMLSRSFKMTAIDPSLDETLQSNRKLKLIRGSFTFDTPIDDYDLVIGLEPCEATEHIVRNCVTHEKEFIVVLCGVPHKQIDGTMPKDTYSWYKYLLSIDPDYLQLRRLEAKDFTPFVIMNKSYK